jgi:hypothetical protein
MAFWKRKFKHECVTACSMFVMNAPCRNGRLPIYFSSLEKNMGKSIKPTSKPKSYKGGCLCGNIKFEARGMPSKPHTCSCKMCQRHTGALTASWVEFPREDVTWTGPGGAPSTYRSSDHSSRAFCPQCGSSIGAIDHAPVVALLIGAFDKNVGLELMPTYQSYRGGRPKWWHVEAKAPEPAPAKD